MASTRPAYSYSLRRALTISTLAIALLLAWRLPLAAQQFAPEDSEATRMERFQPAREPMQESMQEDSVTDPIAPLFQSRPYGAERYSGSSVAWQESFKQGSVTKNESVGPYTKKVRSSDLPVARFAKRWSEVSASPVQQQETRFGDGQPQRQDLGSKDDYLLKPPAVEPRHAWTSDIEGLQRKLDSLEKQLTDEREAAAEADKNGIDIGGAVRFQYSLNDYQRGNNNRLGDIDFDVFRLDLNGAIDGIEMSAQYRWYQYMDVLHHGWIGYDLQCDWQIQAGITRVPFGNLTYNSHSFFFSSAYYVGLEDDYDAGIKLIRETEWDDFRLAYFWTDELGGIDGYVRNRTFRYSYDIVGSRGGGEGTFDAPGNPVAEHNSVSARYIRKTGIAEFGGSVIYGGLKGPSGSAGTRVAYALHLNRTVDRWNLQLQYTGYNFDLNDGSDLVAVGAFGFFDTISAKANLYTANIAYKLPVEIGAITSLNFYNDFNIVSNKSGLNDESIMNVTGVAISAGPVFSNVDLIVAKNHPFVGGSLGQDGGRYTTRLNINVGYYF